MTPRLSIIIPTTGRPSLARALESLGPAGIGPDDEVIVVADGPDAFASAHGLVLGAETDDTDGVVSLIQGPETHDSGNAQRQDGINVAGGTHVCYLDDDDVMAPGALDAIRGAIARYPDAPLIFRMLMPDGRVLPGPDGNIDPDLDEDGAVIRGRIGTPCLVAPRDGHLAPWGTGYCADQEHIFRTLRAWADDGVEPVLLPNVTCIVSDDERGWGDVYVTTCLYGRVPPKWAMAWAALRTRRGDVVERHPPEGMQVDRARNKAVRKFLADPDIAHCASLLFVDDDMVFEPDALERLRSDPAGWPYDVLVGLYRDRHHGIHLVFRERDPLVEGEPPYNVMAGWTPGDVVRVDVAPMGFTLIRRRVLEARAGRGGPWFYAIGNGESTEDIGFSRDADVGKFRMAAHTGVGIGHVGERVWNPYEDMPTVPD